MNPYKQFVNDLARLHQEAKSFPLGKFDPAPRPNLPDNAPKALFFSPHPDDECIVGGIALRVLRETRMRLINVAVTQGSSKERQARRYAELTNACNYLGFELVQTAPNGLERINPKTREHDKAYWSACVDVIARILEKQKPRVIMYPA